MLLHRKEDHAISELFDFNYIISIDTLSLSLCGDWERQQYCTIRTDSAANEFTSSVDDVATAKTNPKLYFDNVLKEYADLIATSNDDDGKYPGLVEFLGKCKRQKILQHMNFLHIACTIAKPKLVELLLENGRFFF